MNKVLILSLLLLVFSQTLIAQVETVPIHNTVYTFLKEMKVKRVIQFIKEDDPILSRFEVNNLLDEISKHRDQLSDTEIKLLEKYKQEFSDDLTEENATQLFNHSNGIIGGIKDVYSDKVKYLYGYEEKNLNLFIEGLGHFYHGQRFYSDHAMNANLFDIGFRIRGTVLDHLGYNLTVIKGGTGGDHKIAEIIEPKLLSNYKWIEAIENIGNYDFTYGYVKYHTEPVCDMHFSLQLGREDITLGYGYGSKLVLSGDNPAMDFIKFNFNYGIVDFTSLHAVTVGYYVAPEDRYSKFYAFNKLKLKFENLFDVGIGEAMIYSGRGIELAYLTPVTFYKFIEMETQDKDNGNLYFDIQTKFIKNFELQGTFFLDEDILSNLAELDRFSNKTAYQLGAFWYQPFSINDLSLIFEYTRIRPYVYTHYNIKNNYTAFGVNLGHRIGPNADELLTRLNYNLNEWIRLTGEYRFVRKGNNVYDEDGNLIKNVGGDVALTHGYVVQNKTAPFLDGERVNTNIYEAGIRIEPLRDFIFDISFNYETYTNLTKNLNEHLSYALLKFTLEY